MTVLRPATLADALARAAEARPVLLAGGTDIYPALRDGPPPSNMLDLTGIAELRGIAKADGQWRIGAATTWTEVLRADLPPLFDGLRAAAREVGSVQIQNAATVAGNLCNASPAADGIPPLLALDAVVEIAGPGGLRRLALGDFVTGPRRTALGPGEVVTAVLVPDVPARSAFLKLGARRYLVISIAMVAATVLREGGRIARAAVAVGACSPVAVRLAGLEQALAGASVGEIGAVVAAAEMPEIAPIDDLRASGSYRAEAVRTLAARAVAQAAGD